MKILKKPELKINEIVTTCIENYSDEDLKKRFLESLRGLEESAVKYDSVAEKGHLHLFPTHDNFSSLTGEELKKLYTDKFSKKGQSGRKYYDEIIATTQTCPYCTIREVNQVDHVLPKADYPAFSVLPYNLVPSCRDCNENKKNPKIFKSSDFHLHPYYDRELDMNAYWLHANIVEESQIQVHYTIDKPITWDSDFFERVKKHFSLFKLDKSYSFYASGYINGEKKCGNR